MSLLLDTYGELLTGKQNSFMQRYYEDDLSFGEIAREFSVSRQAIFDSVKHGEASLEHYERVLGLVAAGYDRRKETPGRRRIRKGVPTETDTRLRQTSSRLRQLSHDMRGRTSSVGGDEPVAETLDRLADQIEDLCDDLIAPHATEALSVPSRAGAPRSSVLLRGGGPEVD